MNTKETFDKLRQRRQQAGTKKAAPPKPKADPRANDPGAITDPLTPKRLDQETSAAVRLKYKPQETAIAGQQRVSTAEQGNITNWFQQYQDAVKAANDKSTAYDAGVQTAVNAQAQQAQTQAQQDPTEANSPQAQQAAAARRTTADSYGALLAAQGSAHNTYLADKGRIGAGEAADQHVKEHGRSVSLAQQLAALKGEEGDFATQYKATARDSERKNALEQAAFGLDTSKANEQALADGGYDPVTGKKLPGKPKSASDKKTEADLAFFKEHGYYPPTGPPKPAKTTTPKGGDTPAGVRAEKNRVAGIKAKSNAALNRLNRLQGLWQSTAATPWATGEKDSNGHDALDPKTHAPKTRKATSKEVTAELVRQGYSLSEIHLMNLIRTGQKWGPQEIVMAHQLGIRVPKNYILANDPGTGVAPGANGQSRPG